MDAGLTPARLLATVTNAVRLTATVGLVLMKATAAMAYFYQNYYSIDYAAEDYVGEWRFYT